MAFNGAQDDVNPKERTNPVHAAFGALIDELAGKLGTAIAFIEKVTDLRTDLSPQDVQRVRADARAVLGEIDSENPHAQESR